jgi:cytochrome c-type protein NapC
LSSVTVIVLFAVITIILAALVAFRADLTRVRGGKILAFIALFLLPSLALWEGFSHLMEDSKTTQFCLSCHVMEDYGRSLYMDNQRYLGAAHFENGQIPSDQACYTCHTNYTMFGGIRDKIRGVQHVYREYVGTVPPPETLKLYHPFNNRECLHCHAHARSYLENTSHRKNPDILPLANANKLSCMSANCHDVVHDVADLKGATFWKEPQ